MERDEDTDTQRQDRVRTQEEDSHERETSGEANTTDTWISDFCPPDL